MKGIRDYIQNIRKEVEELEYLQGKSNNQIKDYIQRFQLSTCSLKIPDGELTINDIPVATKYNRLVIGAHGHYLEFEKDDLLFEPIVEIGEEYRLKNKYSGLVKYYWYTHPDLDIKVYLQRQVVRYADYKPGYYYIDLLVFDNVIFK